MWGNGKALPMMTAVTAQGGTGFEHTKIANLLSWFFVVSWLISTLLKNHLINQWINELKGVYRTAPATPGLLIISLLLIFNQPGVAGVGPPKPLSLIN